MKKLAKFIFYFCNIPIWWLSYITPRNNNIWIFGSWFGDKYADNSKYLFEYVNKNCPEIMAIWLTKNNTTYKLIKRKGFCVYKTFSLQGYFYSLIAKYAFTSTGFMDINFIPSATMKIINLWHGIGGLKKCMMDDNVTRNNTLNLFKKVKFFLFPFLRDNYFLTITTSETMVKILSSAFRGLTKDVQIVSWPRADAFFNLQENVNITNQLLELKNNGKKIGIYMPTHRKEGKVDFSKFLIDSLGELNSHLNSLDIVLLIKLHYYNLKDVESIKKTYSNIIFIKDEDIESDIYTILPLTDFLISDYSSIYYDYLLLKKPIILFPFDKEDYITSDREFYCDYEEVTPGVRAYTWEELYKNIEIVTKEKDYYLEDRQKILDKFNVIQNGDNCETLVNFIRNIKEETHV